MANTYECDADRFATTIEEILKEVTIDIESELPGAVKESCKVGAKSAREMARSFFKQHTGLYASGFTYTAGRKNRECYGEIGNKNAPGLVHLLEKGHATIGGGRVAGRTHVALAAEDTFEVLEELVDKAVEKALGS